MATRARGTPPSRSLPDSRPPAPSPAMLAATGKSLLESAWFSHGLLVLYAGLVALLLTKLLSSNGEGANVPELVVLCLPILGLRRHPLPLMAIGTVGTVLTVGTGGRATPFAAVLAVATYLLATQYPRTLSVPVTVVCACAIGGALLHLVGSPRPDPVGIDTVETYLPLLAAWSIGESVAARRRYLTGLAEQAERERLAEMEKARLGVREERVRIARELHDVVAHSLAVITIQAGVGRRLMERRPLEATNALESIEAIGRTAQEELQLVLGLLREEGAALPTLRPAPGLLELKELIENIEASGSPVELDASGLDHRLSPALELTVHRVIQEALTNVVKHAPGARVVIKLDVGEEEVEIAITDCGSTDPRPLGRQLPGHGILGMRERVSAFGGTLETGALPTGGFQVLARLPIESVV